MDEQRKYAILFAATILRSTEAQRNRATSQCPSRECAIADAIENAKRIPGI